jgi:diguanylate cyclase (GGDEF)-like protein/PAS domain S-box-containing protein
MSANTDQLRVLIVEDRPLDAELMACALEEAGLAFTWTRAETEADFLSALDTAPDIILSDYNLPQFSGPKALDLIRQRELDIPFIIVSGTIGDEQAAEIIRLGADDYLLKDRLGRMGPAVTGALQRWRLRTEMLRAENELRQTQAHLRAFLEHSPAVMFMKDTAGRYLQINHRFAQNFGLDPAQVIGRRDDEFLDPALAAQFQANDRTVLQSGKPVEFEETARYTDGLHTSLVAKFPLRDSDGKIYGVGGIATDISARKLEEERFRANFEQNAIGIAHSGLDGRFLRVNQKFCAMLGYSSEELQARKFADVTHPDDWSLSEHLRACFLEDRSRLSSSVREKRYLRKDGSTVWAEISLAVVRKPDGEPDYFVAMIQDISDRKAAEAELFATFEQAAVGIAHVSLDGRYLRANQKLCDMLGYTREELCAMRTRSFTKPEHCHKDGQSKRLLAGEISTYSGERQYTRKDGSAIWVNRSVSLARDASGKPLYFIRVVEDITERKLSEERFRATFEQAAVGIVHTSLDKRYVAVNQKFCDMLGYTRDELLGKDTADITHPDDRIEDGTHRNRLLAGEIKTFSAEKRYIHKNGSVVWVNRTISLARDHAGKPLYFIRVIEDITQRKRLESRMEQTFEQAAVGIVRSDLDRNIIDANRKFCEMVGYDREEILRMCFQQISHPDDLGKDAAMREQLLAGKISTFRSEKRYVRKDGRVILAKRTTSLARDVGDERLHYIIVVEDITDRKTAEESYRTTFERAPIGIMHTAADRRILHVNPKLCEILGYAREELLAMTTADILPPEHQDSDRPKFFEQMLRGDMQSFSSERPLLRKDGSTVWTNRTVTLVRDAAGQPLYFLRIIEDISDRKRAEMALIESERFAKSTIDALSTHLCVLDENGTIVAVNKAWRDFAMANGGLADCVGIGANYLEVCSAATGSNADEGHSFAAGIRAVLAGELQEFMLEYPCHSPQEQRWFSGKITRFHGVGPRRIVVTHENITERKRAVLILRESEQRFRAIFDHAGVGISMRPAHDRTLPWVQVNDRFCEMLGYTRDELLKLNTAAITHPEDQASAIRDNERLLRGEITNYQRGKRLAHKDGRSVWVILSVASVPDGTGKPEYLIATYQDISEHRRAQEALIESDEKFRQLAGHIPQVFWMTDAAQTSLIYASPNYEQVTGRSLAELQANSRSWLEIIHEHDRERVKNARKTKALTGEYDIEYRIVRTDRTIRWIHDRAFPITNQNGEIYRIAGIGEDITERKEAQQKLMHLAHYDSLTSLPNRVLFHDRLKQMLAQAQRNDWIIGLLFLDLDRFKTVNDTLGHSVGDLLLQKVSERLKLCVRTGDTVGRLGGDEFAIILSELATPQDAGRVAQKIIDAFAPSFDLEGHEVFVTPSIGITVYPGDSQDIETLIRNADAAMYSAKNQGRNNYQFYTSAMNERALEKMQLETRLRRALERQEFLLHYQPKVSISSGEITGFEALLRWQRPDNGLIPPADFVPLLEETGLIVPVGEWVLDAACAQIRDWQRAGLEPVPVAINFSAHQFLQTGLDDMISGTLAKHGVDARWIEIEITESALMQNPEDAVIALRQIKALGISLSVDDFGTGYSSLNYLKRFPLDKLKIDRSFVRDIVADPDDAAITRAVVTMAHSLNLKVVAEGVETEEQLSFLSTHRCDEAQGYLLSRPMPAGACSALLEGGKHLHRPMTTDTSHEPPALLVLDDDADSLELAQHLLQINGYRILTASSTDQAFDLLSRHRVAAIVSDQNMPDMPGVEFLKRVKHMYPGIVRIMLSGTEDFQSATSAINEGGVHRFFVKGRDDEKLRAEIGKILRHGAETISAHSGTVV